MVENITIIFFFALISGITDVIFKCCVLSEIHEMKKLHLNAKEDKEKKDD